MTGLPWSPALRLASQLHPSSLYISISLSVLFFKMLIPWSQPLEWPCHRSHDGQKQALFCPPGTGLRTRSRPQAPPATRKVRGRNSSVHPGFIHIWAHANLFCVCVFCLFRAAPAAHGSSQARGGIRAVAAGLHHSHSHVRSELHLQPTP